MAFDFTLTARQAELQTLGRQFARDVLAPAKAVAESQPTPEQRFLATRPAYGALVAEGLLAKCIPVRDGGEGEGLTDMAVLVEELYAVDASIALTLVGTVLGLFPVLMGGAPEQRRRLLGPFLARTGAPLAAFCSSEPGGSANAASPAPGEGVRTRAVRDGGGWRIDGRKKWVSSATGWQREGAELLCVLCRTDAKAAPEEGISIIAVERPSDRVILEDAGDPVGHLAHLTPQFRLDGVAAPLDNLLGREGDGLALGASCFSGASALVGVLGVALMRSAFDFALSFARTERRGGVDCIVQHQAVGYALADAKMHMEAVRSLAYRACHAVDSGHPGATELANYAKVFGSQTAVRVITDLMRVVGIESYDRRGPLAGLLADALALPIFAGGNLGVRMRQLHGILKAPGYDPSATYRVS